MRYICAGRIAYLGPGVGYVGQKIRVWYFTVHQ